MIYLIVGRTGSGKDYLASLLREKGWKQVKSYTTRPKRTENENTHIFIKPAEANIMTDIVAENTVNGYKYFATKSQVKNADVYIVDPVGVKALTESMPDETFRVVYVTADDLDRRTNAVKRAENKIKEEMIFTNRNNSENEQFAEFEKLVAGVQTDDVPKMPDNITKLYLYQNDYTEATAKNYAEFLANEKKTHERMVNILNECVDLNLIVKTDGKNAFSIKNENGTVSNTTVDHFAELVLGDMNVFADLMINYIVLSDKFKP